MNKAVRSPSRIEATVALPGDKSISHRAVILNSIADGAATVQDYSGGQDVAATIRCMRGLGARITRVSRDAKDRDALSLVVHGNGLDGLREPVSTLNAGNSGTTTRLLCGLMAAQPFFSVLTGDRSLRSRPMGRVIQPLALMGARIMGRGKDSLAPLAIRGGNIRAIDYEMPVASSQVKSAILIAGLHADGQTTVEQPALSRDHTERMLMAMGTEIEVEGPRVTVKPSRLSPLDVKVPGDISAAAFWLVAGCCHPNARIRVTGVGINPTRAGVLSVLQSMGARVRVENAREEGGEPVADLVAESSKLEAVEIKSDLIPRLVDELPVLAVAACFAKGTTVISDAAELRVKESDRIRATVEGLSRLGARIEERPDGMVIHGATPLTGGECHGFDDHRIAMTMAIAGLLASGETVVSGAEAVSVSDPSFWDTLDSITRSRKAGT